MCLLVNACIPHEITLYMSLERCIVPFLYYSFLKCISALKIGCYSSSCRSGMYLYSLTLALIGQTAHFNDRGNGNTQLLIYKCTHFREEWQRNGTMWRFLEKMLQHIYYLMGNAGIYLKGHVKKADRSS